VPAFENPDFGSMSVYANVGCASPSGDNERMSRSCGTR
jgi:hypothetical protein